MRAALRDAKIAKAKASSEKRAEPKLAPWLGLLDLFRGMLGEPRPGPRRRSTRMARQQARRLENERKEKQQRHERWCDKRFAENRQIAATAPQGKPWGMLRRLWKREWIEAEAYAEDAKRAKRKKVAA